MILVPTIFIRLNNYVINFIEPDTIMEEEPQWMIRNAHRKRELKSNQQQKALSFPCIGQTQQQSAQSQSMEDRIQKLQGSLKMLEKQYRANLKEGFDNKIKAYRLEAVVQRKLIKEALASVKEVKEKEHIQHKIERTRDNSLLHSRVEVMKRDRQHRGQLFQQRIRQEKRGYSLSLHEAKVHNEQRAKQSHDKIIQEAENINVKKEYLMQLRTYEVRKKEDELKTLLLSKIMSNTQKLKQLRGTLQDLKQNESKIEKTFLTI